MPRREELPVEEEEERFPIGRAQGAPSDDIGWHFANILQGVNRNTIQCKLCDRVITGGITRLKEHIAHFPGEVKGCGRVTQIIRESMMQLLLDNKAKKNDSRKRKEEFVSLLRGDNNVNHEDLEEEEAIRQATHESMRSHRQWQDGQRFPGSGIDSSSSSGVGVASFGHQRRDLNQRMRNVDVDLERSKSMKQTKVNVGVLKNARQKLAKALSKLIIHERLPINLTTSPWLHNLLNEAARLGPGVKCPSPYEISEIYLNEESLKAAGLKLMEKRPTLYWSPCAAHCLDLCLEDIGKKSNVQRVLDEAKKVTLFIYNHIWTVSLMKKYTNGKELIRPAITRFATQFLQLESIVKEKQGLKAMFDSDEYKNSKYGKDKSGGAAYEAKKIVMSKEFWNKATEILKLLLFRDKQESFGTPQAQQAWRGTDPEDPLSPWLEEIEGPLLDGTQNAQWLPIDSDDDIEEIPSDVDHSNSGHTPSQSGEGGLSPPSDENSGGNGGGGNQEQVHGISEGSHHSFQEEAYDRRDQNLLSRRMEEESCEDMTGGGSSNPSRGRARRGKSKKKANPLDDSSSSSGVQLYGDFGFVAPFEGNQGNFPSYYQNPSYMPHGYYPYMSNPNMPFYNDAPMNYNESSTNSSYDYQQIEPPRSSGLFD
ncbi:unnamed protein product [Trifolium pratense]|uniref:Uncharacterized protein n=1 Tax=Trifolium pratense TaxID=57577 RepID=A0ACB0JBS8_TRIPR|nr:unnamed protein product [Trifolium pratense]